MLKLLAFCTISGIAYHALASGPEFFVSPLGSDRGPGTLSQPFQTIEAAVTAAGHDATITLRGGTYYLDRPLVFGVKNSGITLRSYQGEQPVVSGGFPIKTQWVAFHDGIYKTWQPIDVPTDQLFVNGVGQPLARYPNFDPNAKYFNGVASDVLSSERVKGWGNPTGAYLHALHANEWGDVHYRITGKDSPDTVKYEGGWQNNRQVGMKEDVRFVEGVLEELDAPGEWFLDKSTRILYYYPPSNMDITHAKIEGVSLENLIQLQGSHDVHLTGLTFRHAARTFMDNREPLLRSDWTIDRQGAVLAQGTQACSVEDCFFDSVGGNAVFVDGRNRRFTVRGCRIENAGANGVAFVGNPDAVRSPLFEYNHRQSYSQIDLKPGPRTDDYPSDCLVEDCLIDRTGRIEKQSAPIQISMSRRITVRHCSIYDVPRAGINIGDGCWGGHVIEYCDIFDTVKETGDHGSFNSWGRDRYWGLTDVDLNKLDRDGKQSLPLLDAMEPITLRNNRWRCDHGWDVDLDDGSSNFRIINNLCLNGGLKLREGFHRVCENNVIVNNSFHIHVWFTDSHDIIQKNIVFEPYHVIQTAAPFGECDDNLIHSPSGNGPAQELQKESGGDKSSLFGDAQFIDPAHGDYRVKPGSPALKLGFRNFDMDRFGVTSPSLRKLARTPVLPGATVRQDVADQGTVDWQGAKIKNLKGLGERSATGMGSETGVLVVSVEAGNPAEKMGLKNLDVILGLGDAQIATVKDLEEAFGKLRSGQSAKFKVWRGQKAVSVP